MLPRLTDGAYDLVFVDADKTAYAVYFEQAFGCCDQAAWWRSTTPCGTTGLPTPAQRDAETTVLRELGKTVHDDDRLVSALLAVGDGLLVAVKR